MSNRDIQGDNRDTPLGVLSRLSRPGQGQDGTNVPDVPDVPLLIVEPASGAERPGNRAAVVVGIDIGAAGGLALVTPAGDLVAVEPMPVLSDGPKGRPTVNAVLLAGLLRRWSPVSAVVEFVAARPKESPVGAFSFGRSRGVIEGVLGSQAIPVRWVTPAWWKRRTGIPPGTGMKGIARAKAIARWPHHAELFAREMDHDRAEAALLGVAFITDTQTTRAA